MTDPRPQSQQDVSSFLLDTDASFLSLKEELMSLKEKEKAIQHSVKVFELLHC